MKQIGESVGQRRIFGKALQAALHPSSQLLNGPVACKEKCQKTEVKTARSCRPNVHKIASTEVLAASCKSPLQIEIEGNLSPNPDSDLPANNFIGTSVPDLHSWLKNTHMVSIRETLDMVPCNDTDAWIKKNRLMALQQLQSDLDDEYSSSTSLSPPYKTYSSGETSPVACPSYSMDNPSDFGAFNISSLSSRNLPKSYGINSLKDVPSTNAKLNSEKHDRSIMHHSQDEIKLEMSIERNFSKNEKSSGNNSFFLDKVHSGGKADQEDGFVVKNTKQYLYENPYQEKGTRPKNSKFVGSNVDCCKTFHDNPMAKNRKNVAKLPSYDVSSLMVLKSTTGFFDSHCHIDLLFAREKFKGTYADFMAKHKESYPRSYNGCIAVFCKPFTFAQKEMWQKHLEQDNVWGAFGCHPKSSKFYDAKTEEALLNALDHPKVKALGEIGLDYSKGNKCSKSEQHHAFRRQLRIAQEKKLRVVIHCRDADADTIKIMHEILPKDTFFHLHCFTGNWERAQRWIKEFPNVYIGITNLVTFSSATSTHEVARRLPLERLLLETDAPYFVPSVAPKGTNSSHPGMAIHVAAHIAALKNISVDKVLQWTSSNTRIVYNIT